MLSFLRLSIVVTWMRFNLAIKLRCAFIYLLSFHFESISFGGMQAKQSSSIQIIFFERKIIYKPRCRQCRRDVKWRMKKKKYFLRCIKMYGRNFQFTNKMIEMIELIVDGKIFGVFSVFVVSIAWLYWKFLSWNGNDDCYDIDIDHGFYFSRLLHLSKIYSACIQCS